MKNWQTTKPADAEAYFGPNVKVDVETIGTEVRNVTVTIDGKPMKFESTNSYSENLRILTPLKPKTETKFAVEGKVLGGNGDFKTVVPSEIEAQEVVDRLQADGTMRDGDKVEIKKVEIDIPF